jgi:hypothetical protein
MCSQWGSVSVHVCCSVRVCPTEAGDNPHYDADGTVEMTAYHCIRTAAILSISTLRAVVHTELVLHDKNTASASPNCSQVC